MRLDLLIPDLLSTSWPEPGNPIEKLSLPALEWLLGRGEIETLPDICSEHWLCRIHGLGGCPAAPYALLADGTDPGEDVWLHASPVHLQLNLDRLRVLDAHTFHLDALETADYLAELNQLVEPLGITALATHPDHWYLRIHDAPIIESQPLSLLAGQDLNPRQSLGEGQAFWLKLLNEIQVGFHHLPVNEARLARGELPVSGIWPWGPGRRQTPTHNPYPIVHADNLLAQGLVIASGGRGQTLPAGYASLGKTEHALAVLEHLAPSARYGDAQGWLKAMEELETNWFTPLAQDLRQGRIESLRLIAPRKQGGVMITLRAGDRWKAWRRPKKLAQAVS